MLLIKDKIYLYTKYETGVLPYITYKYKYQVHYRTNYKSQNKLIQDTYIHIDSRIYYWKICS